MFRIVTVPHLTGDFGTFEKYPDATKARDILSKETGAFYSVIDLNEVVAPKAPIDSMWINKELPKVEFTEGMYGQSRMTNTSDEPEGYTGE
jgi:hypothetical protein